MGIQPTIALYLMAIFLAFFAGCADQGVEPILHSELIAVEQIAQPIQGAVYVLSGVQEQPENQALLNMLREHSIEVRDAWSPDPSSLCPLMPVKLGVFLVRLHNMDDRILAFGFQVATTDRTLDNCVTRWWHYYYR